MTSIAVRGDWFLRLPVTVETRSVILRRCFECGSARRVTDRAVVVTLWRMRETQHRDDVLVLVVWKLGRELKFRCGIAKGVTHIIARRGLGVTDRADRRPCATEELRPVTAYTRVVARIILDIGESDFVAGIARGAVFGRGVGEFRVIDR